MTDDELIGYLRENFERIEKKMDRMLKREGVDGLRDDLTLRIQMLQSEITGERMRALSDRMSDSARLSAPRIEKIEVVSKGVVRRARLFYLRDLQGKAARVKDQKDS